MSKRSKNRFREDFYDEEDYEEGEWERAVLSENMWGLNTATPDELKDLLVEFQRCASSGSYNLLDKILRVPVKKNQKKLNLFFIVFAFCLLWCI